MILQVGMRVKIIDDVKNFNEDAGTIKTITADLPKFNNKRAFQLDKERGSTWLIEDFEECVDYPNLPME